MVGKTWGARVMVDVRVWKKYFRWNEPSLYN